MFYTKLIVLLISQKDYEHVKELRLKPYHIE
jgi:hypothetical protein